MLKVTDLNCQRGRRRLFSDLSFELSAGSALELAGVNGSGKTSLLRTLAGLRSSETGAIYWGGDNVSELGGEYRGQLAYLAHEPALKLELTLLENLQFAAAIAGQVTTGLEDALARVGLKNRRHVPASRLSAGQRQRASLARLLMGERPLWLLDEPCAHLDVHGRLLAQTLLQQHLRQGGLLVYTSHQAIELGGVAVQRLELGR